MKKFILKQDFLDLFPEAQIGVLVCRGIDNHVKDEDKYAGWLRECEKLSAQYTENPEFTSNPVIRGWRDAFYKFKTKKGYNGISLKYGVPIGGEDIDKFEGDMRLTIAEGGEDFVTYGSEGKSEPPSEGEVIYRDDFGAVCRCWNWREAERTMLTEDTVNAFMIIEAHNADSAVNMDAAPDELKAMIEAELGGTVSKHLAKADSPEVVIEE